MLRYVRRGERISAGTVHRYVRGGGQGMDGMWEVWVRFVLCCCFCFRCCSWSCWGTHTCTTGLCDVFHCEKRFTYPLNRRRIESRRIEQFLPCVIKYSIRLQDRRRKILSVIVSTEYRFSIPKQVPQDLPTDMLSFSLMLGSYNFNLSLRFYEASMNFIDSYMTNDTSPPPFLTGCTWRQNNTTTSTSRTHWNISTMRDDTVA